MKLLKIFCTAVFMLSEITLIACSPSLSPDVYTTRSAGQARTVTKGVIVSFQPVTVSNDFNAQGSGGGAGTFAGAALGGIAGSQIGGSVAANAAGAVGGAVLGGIIGNVAEKKLTQQTAIQYVIKRPNGSLISVVQGPEPQLSRGQHVLVIYGSNRTRVIPDTSY